MSLFSKIFGETPSRKECPRCLGKGHVDWNDIKRLNKELKWKPGSCAYCNGEGRIDPKTENNIPADTTYLATDLSDDEKRRLLSGHPDALEKAYLFDERVNDFINQVWYLHLNAGMKASAIAAFFLIPVKKSAGYDREMQELTDYVERVIQTKTLAN